MPSGCPSWPPLYGRRQRSPSHPLQILPTPGAPHSPSDRCSPIKSRPLSCIKAGRASQSGSLLTSHRLPKQLWCRGVEFQGMRTSNAPRISWELGKNANGHVSKGSVRFAGRRNACASLALYSLREGQRNRYPPVGEASASRNDNWMYRR